MFKFNNIINALPLTITYTHGRSTPVEFIVSELLSKRNKSELIAGDQMSLINDYIASKDRSFRNAFYDKIVEVNREIGKLTLVPTVRPLPKSIIGELLDMLSWDDVRSFIARHPKVTPPVMLKEVFDESYGVGGLGTRDQTYLVSDYYDLVTLITIMKVVAGPIGQFGYIKNGVLNKLGFSMILLELIKEHPIYTTPAVVKLITFTSRIMEINGVTPVSNSNNVIDKMLPNENMLDYLTAIVLLHQLPGMDVVGDCDERNVVTRLYNKIINKLTPKGGDTTKLIDLKQKLSADDINDKESMLESYRIRSDFSGGDLVELDWSMSDFELIRKQYGVKISDDIVAVGASGCEVHRLHVVSDIHLAIVRIVLGRLIDSRALEYLSIDSLMNTYKLTFGILWTLGHMNLASIMMAVVTKAVEGSVIINTGLNRCRLTQESKMTLLELYPHERQVNSGKTVNLGEKRVNELGGMISDVRWYSLLPSDMLVEVNKKSNPNNIKNDIVELLKSMEVLYVRK